MNYNRGGGGLCPHQRRKQIYALGVGRVEGHWECLSGIPAKPAEYLKSENHKRLNWGFKSMLSHNVL